MDALESMDSRSLGEFIVERLRHECDAARGNEPSEKSDLLLKSELMMFAPSRVMGSIAKFGFSNQHLTRTSSGILGPLSRYEKEQMIAGLRFPYTHKIREFLPKYAVLSLNFTGIPIQLRKRPDTYGDAIFVFKDSVKRRTTWTTTDSYEPRLLTDLPATTLFFSPKPEKPVSCWEYCEAQIWGPLDLSDVAYIMLPPGSQAIEVLKGIPIKVFTYKWLPDSMELPGKGLPIQKLELIQDHPGTAILPMPITSRAEIESTLKNTSDTVEKRILQSRLLETWTTQELIDAAKKVVKNEEQTNAWEMLPIEQSGLIVAELVSRKTSEVRALLEEYTHNKDPFIREQAILGLTRYDDGGFQRKVISMLNDSRDEVRKTAIALAYGFRNDWGVLRKVRKSASPESGVASFYPWETRQRWFQQLYETQKLCEK